MSKTTPATWIRLFAFPKLILHFPHRSSNRYERSHAPSQSSLVAARLRGASGLQVAHLLEATTTRSPQLNGSAVHGIVMVVGLLIDGKLPAALAPALTPPPHSPAQEGLKKGRARAGKG